MTIWWVGLVAVLLAACMSDNYAPVSGLAVSSNTKSADVYACRQQAMAKYFAARHAAGDPGAVFGAIGSIADATSTHPENPDASVNNIDPNIEACMRAKGYAGTSSG